MCSHCSCCSAKGLPSFTSEEYHKQMGRSEHYKDFWWWYAKKQGGKNRVPIEKLQKISTKQIRLTVAETGDESQTPRIQVPPKKMPSLVPGPSLINSIFSIIYTSSQSLCSTSLAASVLGSSLTSSVHPATQVQLHPFMHSPTSPPPPPHLSSQTLTRPPPPLFQPYLQPGPSSVVYDNWQPSSSLINAPMQVSTPLFYAPLYLSGETQSPAKK